MTYTEAARILSLYATKIYSPDLGTAIMMGAAALYRRAAEEKAIVYSEDNPDGELIDIS